RDTREKKNAKSTPRITRATLPTRNQTATPAIPDVIAAPKKRPKAPRSAVPRIGMRKKASSASSGSELLPWEALRGWAACAGSGSFSPSIALMIASVPASIPPEKSPPRKCGATRSATMRLESASVRVPCTPRPVWMRILWSSLATTKSTPSSTPLRPSFHSSVTRPANSSIASDPIVGTRRTTTCEPCSCSKATSFASSPARCGAPSVEVRSTTCPVSLGTGTSCGHASVAAARSASAARKRRTLLLRGGGHDGRWCRGRGQRRRRPREIDLRRLGDGLLVLDSEGRLLLVAEDHRGQVFRELAREHVVVLDGLDEA